MGLLIPAEVEAVLDRGMSHELVRTFTENGVTYFLIDEHDQDTGGQVLVGQAADKSLSVISGDSAVLADPALRIPASARNALALGLQLESAFVFDAGVVRSTPTTLLDQGKLDKLVFDSAQASKDTLDTHLPELANGHLACAFAVNQVVRRALGRPINSSPSTTVMGKTLADHHISVAESAVKPGIVVISPTNGTHIGHVGIVGEAQGNDPNARLIYSNSSSRGVFTQNYTIGRWKAEVGAARGLPVLFFELARSEFPQVSLTS